MKINHNMSAMIANKNLLRNDRSLSGSIERLSTGLRINRASDDAAGMAIASKMRAQIKGLGQASRNASDGSSVLETADGALNEVVNMLQRMRELSVQAASTATYTIEDVEAIQAEIHSLREEIDRVSRDTEFNTQPLLNGNLDRRVYPNNRGITRMSITDFVSKDIYAVQISADAEHAVSIGGQNLNAASVVPAGATGEITINGVTVEINEGETFDVVYEKLRECAELGETNLFLTQNTTPNPATGKPENAFYTPSTVDAGGFLVFVSDEYGISTELNVHCDNPDLATFLGIGTNIQEYGKDVEITIPDTYTLDGVTEDNGFAAQRTIVTDGNYVTITSRGGFEMKFEVEPGTAPAAGGAATEVLFDVTDIGTLTLQIGANENQIMDVCIPEISSKTLYIDKVNVCTVTGADRAIESFDKALSIVGEVRSALGAYMNRLDYAVSSLDGTEINMTQALSRIEDTDMAEEMTTYTQYNVLTQAATSVLAQANDLPQQVLQLLQ